MSYRLINANSLAMSREKVNDMPCIYADLPNGLDGGYYNLTRGNTDKSRYSELFGTPERATRTLLQCSIECNGTISYCDRCPFYGVMTCPGNFEEGDYDELLEWLEGESDGE